MLLIEVYLRASLDTLYFEYGLILKRHIMVMYDYECRLHECFRYYQNPCNESNMGQISSIHVYVLHRLIGLLVSDKTIIRRYKVTYIINYIVPLGFESCCFHLRSGIVFCLFTRHTCTSPLIIVMNKCTSFNF